MRILAIDPGNTESGYAIIDADTYQPIEIGKITNYELRQQIKNGGLLSRIDHVAIEMIASYGMPVGKEVFETCVWIGRYLELIFPTDVQLIYRKDVKLHFCHTIKKVGDPNITQALVDRFTPGASNHGKGTKNTPGWFHGFKADIWAAYALAVLTADTCNVADGRRVYTREPAL